MGGKEEVPVFEIKKFLRSRGFAIGLALSIIMMLIQLSIDWTNVNLTLWGMNAGSFLVLFILAVIAYPIKALRLRADEYAIIFAMITVSLGFAWSVAVPFSIVIFNYAPEKQWWGMGGWVSSLPGALQTSPLFGSLSNEAALAAFTGGVPVPWSEWLPSVIYWMIFTTVLVIFMVSMGMILRKQWIDIEKLPFPFLNVTKELIAIGTGTVEKTRVKRILIGFILGILLVIGNLIDALAPGRGWNLWQTIHLAELEKILPNSSWFFSIGPALLALWYFAPLDVLFTAMVSWFIFADLLPAISVWAGYATLQAPWGSSGGAWHNMASCTITPISGGMIGWGAMIGLGFWLLVFSRKYLAQTLKNAFGSKVLDESEEPFSYRSLWLMFIISTILLIALMVLVYIPIWAALIILVYIFFQYISTSRIRGESIAKGDTPWESQEVLATLLSQAGLYALVGTGASEATQAAYGAGAFTSWNMAYIVSGHYTWYWGGAGTPQSAQLEGFRLASEVKLHNKAMAISTMVAMILAVVICIPLWLILTYAVGIEKGFGYGGTLYSQWVSPAWWAQEALFNAAFNQLQGCSWFNWNKDLLILQLANWAGGFILAGVLLGLRAMFIRVPINPVGLIIGGSQIMHWMWGYITVAWILKFLTFRIGGSKLYEEYGIPLAVGIFLGAFLIQVITDIFVPVAQAGISWAPE
ncbi:MAG: DUF6785 family protein [Candidatus Bathyarchaeia archaeon]